MRKTTILIFLLLPSAIFAQADATLANEYFHLADSLSKAAQYDSAIFHFEKASEIYLSAAKADLPDTTLALDSLPPKALAQEGGMEIRSSYETYLAMHITCYRQIGWNYLKKAEHLTAIEYLEKGLEKAVLSSSSPSLPHIIHVREAGKLMSNSSLPIDKSREGAGNKILIAMTGCYNVLGVVYRNKADYDKALEYHQLALDILKIADKNHPRIIACYGNIGTIYLDRGDFGTALEYYQQCLFKSLKIFEHDHLYVALSYNNLGIVNRKTGNYDKALKHLQKSLSILLKTVGPEHPRVAGVYNNLGNVYKRKAEYEKGLEYHQKALSIRLKTLGTNHPAVAASYANLGELYLAKMEFSNAIKYQNKSLPIFREVFGDYHPDVGMVYNSIAAIYVTKATIEDGAWSMEHRARSKEQSQPSPKLHAPRLLDTALFYYQKAIQSLVKGFSANSIYVNPVLKKVFIPGKTPKMEGVQSMPVLKDVLVEKAEAFELRWNYKNKD